MDPTNREPEEYGREDDRSEDATEPRRQSREALTPDFGHQAAQQSRTVRLTSGSFLLTVNPVDGSEIEPCRPGEQPPTPVRRTAAQRAERERAAAPPVPPGPPAPRLPLLERQDERERLVRLLARGRSVRLTGPAGSGRTALLNAVAADCADLAPDGVVRLSGHKRTVTDLLYGLFETVYEAPLYRPDREGLLALLHGIGAVVVLDDLELGGAALQELLDATPECAFLFAATAEVPTPAADTDLEEVFLSGLGRGTSLELLEHVVERALTDEEANWAGDLWFESEGLPLRFVQAGALLRQRDEMRADPQSPHGPEDDEPADTPFGRIEPKDPPLPSLGEGAAPAALLASRLSEAARETLHFAVALGGEVPHQAHLPALVGDTHADAALGELSQCGLLSPAGPRYRLAAGVLAQLEAGGYGDDAAARARSAAQHYAWWAGHPSVTPERAVAEADALLASMAPLLPGEAGGQAGVAVLLARSASPAFAAGMHWSAWEKALRIGQEAARIAGEVAEEAYFHHELGVLALCAGHLDRARAELEASIGMRGALADKAGAVAGRRALALVEDRSGTPAPGAGVLAAEVPHALPPGGVPAAPPLFPRHIEEPHTLVSRQVPPPPAARAPARVPGGLPRVFLSARRNLAAVGAGALLAAVLGTMVTLGVTSGGEDPEGRDVTTEQSVTEDEAGQDGPPTDEPAEDPVSGDGPAGGAVSPGAPDSAVPSGSATPSPGTSSPEESPEPTDSSSGSPSDPPASGDPSPTVKPTRPTTTPTSSPPATSPEPSPSESTTEPAPSETATGPETTNSASGPAESATASDAGTGPESPSDATPAVA
ncbi:ATP-binding protein [Streptomyces griseus]|uniref:ATP-binding protein n=1 Tax=Streptomyces griseus TaxID=1911 RepID=UPI0008408C2F|nr:ATP-binding protein [Streptomyces griseus]